MIFFFQEAVLFVFKTIWSFLPLVKPFARKIKAGVPSKQENSYESWLLVEEPQ